MKKALLLFAAVAMAVSTLPAKRIVVNLSKQRACAYEGGSPVFCGNISSGKPGHRTPTGHFRVLEKDIDHVSSKYPEPNGGAKMHYMLRLTTGGIAMHLGYVPNYPASHGCIRMQNGFAQRMYSWASTGTPVSVIGYPSSYVSRSSSKTYGTSFNRKTRKTHYARKSHKSRRSSSRIRSRYTYNATATDILAEFMGRDVSRRSIRHHSKRYKKYSKRYTKKKRRSRHSRRSRHHRRHGDPLRAMR